MKVYVCYNHEMEDTQIEKVTLDETEAIEYEKQEDKYISYYYEEFEVKI